MRSRVRAPGLQARSASLLGAGAEGGWGFVPAIAEGLAAAELAIFDDSTALLCVYLIAAQFIYVVAI